VGAEEEHLDPAGLTGIGEGRCEHDRKLESDDGKQLIRHGNFLLVTVRSAV